MLWVICFSVLENSYDFNRKMKNATNFEISKSKGTSFVSQVWHNLYELVVY